MSIGIEENHTWSSQAWSLLKMIAAPRLLAGLMPVPVMGMVARWTKKTANPMGRGAKICSEVMQSAADEKQNHQPHSQEKHLQKALYMSHKRPK